MLPFLLAQQAASNASPLPKLLPFANGALMLDVVFLAMFLIVPLMGVSIWLVKYRRMFVVHKWLQIGMGVVLLVAVTAFEIDLRFFTDWEELAANSRFWVAGEWNLIWISLVVHLCFAVPTPFIWIFVIVQAVRKIPNPPAPSPYSGSHIFWARVAAVEMTLTAVTGWVFYALAFIF